MIVHLVDGTYELFRQFFARPSRLNDDGVEIAAARAVVRSVMTMLEDGVTHVGVACDTVIESFRNELYDGYKDGSGIDPLLWNQFPLVEEGLRALGVPTFSMIEYEADDGLAAAAALSAADDRVEQVRIWTPDKDLAQCVVGDRVVQYDRRNDKVVDHDGVIEKFGVAPASIPDYLALVGDSADGFPGLAGWGAKSSSTVLARYEHLEHIPLAPGQWEVSVRGSAKLANTLAEGMADAVLFRTLATLALDAPTVDSVDELEWQGATAALPEVAGMLEARDLMRRADELAATR